MGRNWFYELHEKAKHTKDWFTCIFKASETKIIPDEELKAAKLGFFNFFIGIWDVCINLTSNPYSFNFSATLYACPPIPPVYFGAINRIFISLKN